MSKDKFINLICELDHQQMLLLLESLGKDEEVRKRMIEHSSILLEQIKAEEELVEDVFRQLNAIFVVDLWESSGKGRYGEYSDSVDVAFDMVNDVVQPFRDKMLSYRRLGLKEQESTYFKAIVKGLLKYGEEGTNEFHDWCIDDADLIADNEIYDWHQTYPETSLDQLEELCGITRTK